ncbi:MAG: hypothetical protein ACUVQT_08050, partial [bacterium]
MPNAVASAFVRLSDDDHCQIFSGRFYPNTLDDKPWAIIDGNNIFLRIGSTISRVSNQITQEMSC